MLSQLLLARQAGPTPHFTVQEQCKSTQVAALARAPKIAEQILESKLQLQRKGVHVTRSLVQRRLALLAPLVTEA